MRLRRAGRAVSSNRCGKDVGRDAGTVVGDADDGMSGSIFAAGDVNRAPARRVTQRVVEDVASARSNASRSIATEGPSVSRHLEPDSPLVGCELERGGRVDDRFREVRGLQPGPLVDVARA